VLLRVQVEHEADQRPLQPRSRAHVNRKPRAAQLGRAFQVENAERLAQLPVRLGLKSKWASRPRFDGEVVGLGFAGGHFVAGEVGNAGQQLAQPVVEGRGGRSSSSSLSLSARVSSISAVASCPAFFSAPTCWLSSLRRALSRSAVVMASRRL
jgi:hypothetical protein